MINPIVYNKQYVMTSAMAANFFECPVVNLKKNYQRNQKRFKPGEEYFKLEGEELAIFKAKFNEDVEAALTNEDDLDKVTNCPPCSAERESAVLVDEARDIATRQDSQHR